MSPRLASLSAVAFACAINSAACSSNGLGGDAPDLGPPPVDLTITEMEEHTPFPDLVSPDLTTVSAIGAPCPNGNECSPGQVCLGARLGWSLPPIGYCTAGCVTDRDCPANSFCGPMIPGVGALCFANCDANGGCPTGQVCSRRLAGNVDLVKTACLPGNAGAKDGDPCITWGDCNRNQACANNPFQSPNGYCATIGCKPGDDTTCSPAPGNSAHCINTGAYTACLAACTVDNDCRVADHYICVAPAQGYPQVCLVPHATAGAACTVDAQCGPAGTPWRCMTGPAFPGGDCGGTFGKCSPLDTRTCPDNAHCYDPSPALPMSGDEFCTRDCAADTDCRQADGYKCQGIGPNLKGCRL